MTVYATTREVSSAGSSLYVLDIAPGTAGDAAPVVFSHGAGGCHINWYHQVAEFSRDRRVIVWDQRGFGRSADPEQLASPHQAAEDLIAVLDACGVDRVSLVAQSMAGWGASLCLRANPGRFAGLVLCDTSAGVVTSDIAARLDRFRARSADKAASSEFFNSLAVDPSWVERDLASATGLHLWSRSLPATYSSAVADLIATQVPVDHLQGLPVGVIAGEHDAVFPPETLREELGHVADLGVHQIDGAGHSPYLETPDKFNAVLRSLLSPTRI